MNFLEIRKKYGLTQMDFAKNVGVSMSAYILWEKGVQQPKQENQEKIEDFVKRLEQEEK